MLRVAFAGTPPFARAILDRLIEQGFAVGLVMSQPDRPSGRGMKLLASPVKTLAAAAGIEILQPRGLRLDGKFAADAALAQAALERAAIDVLVVAAYGLILPPWLLALPRHGCLNVHASLLPRWRGAAPIQRAIEAGDALSGITIMQMDAGLDTGAVIDSRSIPIAADETAASLQDRLAGLGAERIVAALRVLAGQALAATPQPADGVSYAAKISKAEAAIDWGQPAAVIERRLRAFDPAPGARGELDGQVLTLWRGRVEGGEGRPGEVFVGDGGTLSVACGEQRLAILELQRAGGRRLPAAEFLRGWRPPPGASFAAASEAARQLEHQRGR